MALKNITYGDKDFSISYEIINPKAQKDIIFLHGWGSNKEVMKQAFANVLSEYRHVYIDMPGFGKSPNRYILRTDDYKEIIQLFINELGLKKDIIAGHSFGGKVATLLNPDRLVLLSSAGIVVKKPIGVKLKIIIYKMLKKIGLGSFYRLFATKDVKGMEKNMYETLKNVVDEDFSNHFSDFKNRALVFWGEEDTATPVDSGKRVSSLIKGSRFFLLQGDHYFFLKNARFIEDKIRESTL